MLAKILQKSLGVINLFLPNPPMPTVNLSIPELKYTSNNTSNLYKIVEDSTYVIGDFIYTLKAGFEWDGASIPNWAWNIVGTPYEPRFMAASALHDDMYRKTLPRKHADLYFYWILLNSGVKQTIAEKMYYAVRIGGKIPYKKYKKKNEL